MDALGHVNNIVYFRYFESARMAYFERIGFGEPATGIGPILAETRCRFRAPLRYPDYIAVGARARAVETDRFTMDYAVAGHRDRRIVAEGSGLVVCYDYQSHRKTALPGAIVDAIEQLQSP
ncbi:MAG: acyl-CoA thioesterase [Gammaproteobacteria bacterium]|nr:acyl-CoA thioesterase [Gammaproteobacteria bacterium]NNF60567.1 acyl-CoA thioesterase [Gammaproteobacteria bacterium]